MALVSLNLYCRPSDIFDYISVEGAELRVDDHNDATGQRIQTTAAAAVGATSLAVTVLQFPLLRGTVLQFDGAGTEEEAEVRLTATASAGAISLTVEPLEVAINSLSQAFDSGVNLVQAQRLLKGCQYGTAQVKMYACNRYDDSDLQTCWSANRYATIAGAKWVCTRRGQACPVGIKEDWEAALEELKQIRRSMLDFEDIAPRTSAWPFITNVTVDVRYTNAKVRQQPNISEQTPTQYGQYVDWNSIFFVEW